eukprot:TRINITY_DN77_c0_g1_i2.p1 TRINITY_DN77_c0_g1~~TRINITY_DN77_c0_g1_i2.p1  ORF type:complete len:688 (+),score=103.43 TRINITY_DN77_c0_g1_i2:1639-3702(+)
MIIFLLKSTACMAIFLTFYKVLLENESMHQFKRFFLIAALVSSFIIPSIVFTEYIEIEPSDVSTQVLAIEQNIENQNIAKEVAQSPLNWSLALWTIYGIGVVGFGFRFIRHLIQLWSRIRNNPKLKQNSITNVLLKQQLPPHTFFNFIFLNKHKFETKSIPNSVLLHEETHALQKHSLDVLLIEFLQVLFWFNPVIYFFKKSIKLNHEFLADSAVLKNNEDQLNYQHTLLSYLSNGNYNVHQSVGIANAINYSSIKKRFIIMKKQTSKKGFLIRSLLLLPLLAIMLYSFSNRKEKFISETHVYSLNGEWLNEENELEILKITEENENLLWGNNQGLILKFEKINGQFYYSEFNKEKLLVETNLKEKTILVNGKKFIRKENSLRNQLNGIWLNEQNNTKIIVSEYDIYMVFDLLEGDKKTVRYYPKKRFNSYYFTYGYEDWSFKIENNKLVDSRGNHYTRLEENQTESKIYQYNSLARKYNSIPIAERNIPLNDLKTLEAIYSSMSETQKKEAHPFPECLPKKQQETATKKQIADYNILAKKYNTMISKGGNIRIMKSDVDKLTNIYEIMSDEQKISAQPFPDFPEPPPAPNAPFIHRGEKSDIPPPPSPNVKKGDISNIPPPPTPPSPLDYVISMAKKGATFLYEDKKISSGKAIELLKKNKDLNIESREKNGKAEVRITKEPVTIE